MNFVEQSLLNSEFRTGNDCVIHAYEHLNLNQNFSITTRQKIKLTIYFRRKIFLYQNIIQVFFFVPRYILRNFNSKFSSRMHKSRNHFHFEIFTVYL